MNRLDKLTDPLNCFLAACYEIFGQVNSLEYNKTRFSDSYLGIFNGQFINPRITKVRHKFVNIYLFIRL